MKFSIPLSVLLSVVVVESQLVPPPGPVLPNTSEDCSNWYLPTSSDTCASIAAENFITVANFVSWNPFAGAGGGCTLAVGFAYCTEINFGDIPVTTTTTTTARSTTLVTSTTSVQSTTTTTAGNGIATPTPVLPGIVSNCDVFYLVKPGDTCDVISKARGVSVADIIRFNPGARSDCTGLWGEYYICISIVGHSLSTVTTTKPPATTTPSNGIATPTPILPGMASNCDVFHLVKAGDTCEVISKARGVSVADFIRFNPGVKPDCTGLWLGYQVCVSIIGHSLSTATTTTTKQGNGVNTPVPFQTGMVTNCKTFDEVTSGESCDSISRARGITLANFIRWNPAVGPNCGTLWLGTWACVGLI